MSTTLTSLIAHLETIGTATAGISSCEFGYFHEAAARPDNDYPRLEIQPDIPASTIDKFRLIAGAAHEIYNLQLCFSALYSPGEKAATTVFEKYKDLKDSAYNFLYTAFRGNYAQTYVLLSNPEVILVPVAKGVKRVEVIVKLKVQVNIGCAEDYEA